ncbi:response regulator [Nitrospira sp.]|nr:response regulator [Nitrospira sp.]
MAKILVIDDEPFVLELLNTVLKRKGHEVILASMGHRGIETFVKEHPQVTILDLNLPDMDGISVLKKIRSVNPSAPVVMLTGGGSETAQDEARELGVVDFLPKEFSLHRLGDALSRALGAAALPASVSGRAG